MTNPNQAPFSKQVHEDRRTEAVTGLSQNQLAGLRGKLIESLMQLITSAITGSFIPGPLGSAFSQLKSWADDIGGSIANIPTTIGNAITSALDGFTSSIIGGDTGISFPHSFPESFGTGTGGPISVFFGNLRALLPGIDLTQLITNPVAAWTTIITNALKPVGLLGFLNPSTGRLLDEQAPQAFLDLTTQMNNALNGLASLITGGIGIGTGGGTSVITDPIQLALQQVYNTIYTLQNLANSALQGALTAVGGATSAVGATQAAAVTGGQSTSANFDGTASAPIKEMAVYLDNANGSWVLDGAGMTTWINATSTINTAVGMLSTDGGTTPHPLATNYQRVSGVLGQAPGDVGTGTEPGIFLFGRSNAARTDRVHASIHKNNIAIGYYLNGNYAELKGGYMQDAWQATDKFDLFLGDATDDRHFILKRNDLVILEVTDTAKVTAMDANHLYAGAGSATGYGFGFLFIPYPVLPAQFTTVTGNDRLPSAA